MIIDSIYNLVRGFFSLPIILNASGEFLGSLVLAILIYFVSKRIFKYPDISGKWIFKVITKNTYKTDYLDMQLTYQVFLMQIDGEVNGSGEKIHEQSKKNPDMPYYGAKRSQISITGNIKRSFNLKRSNDLFIHIKETNAARDSSTIHKLVISKNGTSMKGDFYSTIANQSGTVTWEKDE